MVASHAILGMDATSKSGPSASDKIPICRGQDMAPRHGHPPIRQSSPLVLRALDRETRGTRACGTHAERPIIHHSVRHLAGCFFKLRCGITKYKLGRRRLSPACAVFAHDLGIDQTFLGQTLLV